MKFPSRLDRRFQGWHIYLYVDKAKWHQGPEIDSFLADNPHFDLEYLPSYHPELNRVDRLWKRLRYEVTTNKYFASLDDIVCSPESAVPLEASKNHFIMQNKLNAVSLG